MIKFSITSDFITLGQFLKATDHIGSGGEAKFFLFEEKVFVNQERRTERGKKLYPGDIVKLKKVEYQITNDQKDSTQKH
ncbi:MAG: S4 domain-containing protein YaaA [Acholeplasmataceae bacterium]|jgi:S4 domain protein YaaA|nr:S4 domain-containing protein YaaA [Acholeplasmataceae bacterium]